MQKIYEIEEAGILLGRRCKIHSDYSPGTTKFDGKLVAWSQRSQQWLVYSEVLVQNNQGHDGNDCTCTVGTPVDSDSGHWWCITSEITLLPLVRYALQGNELTLLDN